MEIFLVCSGALPGWLVAVYSMLALLACLRAPLWWCGALLRLLLLPLLLLLVLLVYVPYLSTAERALACLLLLHSLPADFLCTLLRAAECWGGACWACCVLSWHLLCTDLAPTMR